MRNLKEISDNKKINKEKLKQLVLIVFAVLLIGVGFANYNPDKDKQMAIVENEDMIGDVELVSSNAVVDNESLSNSLLSKNTGNIVENTENFGNSENAGNVENVSENSSADYFQNTRLERDTMYSKMLYSYNQILDNEKVVETQKAIAVQEITKITNNQNAIMIAENLIKNKGFEDAVILINSDVINVVVKTPHLSNEDIGKIQNIIEREFSVELEKVNISSKY